MNFRKHRLMSEFNGTEAGGDSLDISSLNSSSSNDNSNDFEIGSDSDAFKAYGLDPDKYKLDEDKSSDAPKEESHGSEETKEAGQAIDEKAYLEWVNSLGAIHGDAPVKVESADEVKNALQMFKDYTQKTQSLSEERKGWDSEKTQAEGIVQETVNQLNESIKQHNDQLQELQQLTFTMNNLKENQPDLYEEIMSAHARTKSQYSNPVIDQQLAQVRAESAAIRAELAETKKGLTQREDKLIVDSFESEYSKLSATEQSLKELGIMVNKDEVKKKWAETGLSPEEVIGSMYGMKAMQAQASKSKVATTKEKIQAKPVGIGSKSRSGDKQTNIDPKLQGFDRAMALYKQLQG